MIIGETPQNVGRWVLQPKGFLPRPVKDVLLHPAANADK